MRYVLQMAKAQEVPEIFSIYQSRIRWMNTMGLRQWNRTEYLQRYPLPYFRQLQEQGVLYVLREEFSGKIIGAGALLQEDDRWPNSYGAVYVHHLVTLPEVKGAGRVFLAQAEMLALEQGKRRICLDCAEDNAVLNHYYESLGYQAAGQCMDGPYCGIRREKLLSVV